MPDTYVSIERLKSFLDMAAADDADEPDLEAVLVDASRAVDEFTRRRFYTATETRRFTADSRDVLFLGLTKDLVSVTTIKTDDNDDGAFETTWDAADYALRPFNAVVDGKPYQSIQTRNGKMFPRHSEGVEIAGTFGYPVVPPQVQRATLLWAARLFGRKDTLFGLAAPNEFGPTRITWNDRDVATLLAPFVRSLEVA